MVFVPAGALDGGVKAVQVVFWQVMDILVVQEHAPGSRALQAQQEFNATLVDHLNRTVAAHEQATRTAAAIVEAARRELEALVRFEWLLLQLLQTVGGPELREQIGLIQQRLVMVERDMARAPERRPAGPGGAPSPPGHEQSSAAAASPRPDFFKYAYIFQILA